MDLTRRAALMGMILAGLPLPLAARGETRLSGRAFGSSWTVLARDLADPAGAAERISAVLAKIDAEMSPYRPSSAVSRFNAGERRIAVGAALAEVVTAALAAAEASAGAYDPTVGPVVNRYGFGPIRGQYQPGIWQSIRCEGGFLDGPEGATLDLCGIAKGFAVDALVAALRAEAGECIVEIGGEIRAVGAWPVAIADPLGGIARRITLRDAALATSGDGVQGFSHGGRRWSHIIDPKTAMPVSGDLASVSVIAATAMQADAMATALMVMGRDQGMALASKMDFGALFLSRSAEGLQHLANPAFDRTTI